MKNLFEPMSLEDCLETESKFISEAFAGETSRSHISSAISIMEEAGGFETGELVVVGGRPGMGKTSLCLNFVLRFASAKDSHGVLYLSSQGTAEKIIQRMVMIETRFSCSLPNDAAGSAEERGLQLHSAFERIRKLPVYIDDSLLISESFSLDKIVSFVKEKSIKVIFIDSPDSSVFANSWFVDNPKDAYQNLPWRLKNLALKNNILIVCTSQLARNVDSRNPQYPQLCDLRPFAEFESAADIVMLLHREAYYDAKKDQTKATLLLEKHRRGQRQRIPVAFSPECGFFNFARE